MTYKPTACMSQITMGHKAILWAELEEGGKNELRGGGPAIAANSSGFTRPSNLIWYFYLTYNFFNFFPTKLLTKMRLRGYNRHVRVKG